MPYSKKKKGNKGNLGYNVYLFLFLILEALGSLKKMVFPFG